MVSSNLLGYRRDPNNEKANYLYIKERRKSLVQHTPLLEGDVTLERRFRDEHLHYKVVMV